MEQYYMKFRSMRFQYLSIFIMITWISASGQTISPRFSGRTVVDTISNSSVITPLDKVTSDQTVIFEQVHFVNSTTGWVVGSNGVIRKTTTGGVTWVEENSTTTAYLCNLFFLNNVIGWLCGKQGTIVNTTDGGATWTVQHSGVDVHLYSLSFIDASHGWVCGDSGVVLSTTDGGSNWIIQNSGTTIDLHSVSFTDINHGWAVGNLGIIIHTTDGGINWTPQTSTTGVPLYPVEFTDTLHGWAAGGNFGSYYGIILRTTDGGAFWTDITSSLPLLPMFFDVDFLDANTGWIVGRYGHILKTTNGGNTWSDQGINNDWLSSVSFVNCTTGWISTQSGLLMKTTNGGSSWTILDINNVVTPPPPPSQNISIKDVPNDNGKQVFVKWWMTSPPITSGITHFTIYRYDEQNWTYLDEIPVLADTVYQVVVPTIFDSTITYGMNWSVFRVIAHTADPAIYSLIGPDSGYSVDNLPPLAPTGGTAMQMPNGNTMIRWKPAINANGDFKQYILYRSIQSDFIPSAANRIAYVQDTVFIDLNTQGSSYYYKVVSEDYSGNESAPLDISNLTGVALENSNIPESSILSQNYPNPFNPSTNIKFGIHQESYVTLKIYDLTGREIITLIAGNMFPGYYTIPFHSKNLSNGVYLYRLQTGANVFTRKMLLLK